MRYFKYESPVPPETEEQQKQNAALLKETAKVHRREKVFDLLGWIVAIVVFLALFVASQWINGWVLDRIEEMFANASLIWVIFSVILGLLFTVCFEIAAIGVSLLLATLAVLPLWGPMDGKLRKKPARQRQELLSETCAHLREFYGFQEPCVVTKCYDSSDRRFKDHDICLFLADEELRLTTNLRHGFLDMRRDLGCYAFAAGEIQLSEDSAGNRPAVELKAGEVTFLLGQRARAFVEQNLISLQDGSNTATVTLKGE